MKKPLGKKDLKLFEDLMVYQENVFCLCLGFVKNPGDAEDLTQEVFLKAYKKISSLKSPDSSKEWLFRIARNTCLDFGKRLKIIRFFHLKSEDFAVEEKTLEHKILHREKLQKLKDVVSRLPNKQKEVFVLREYNDLSYDEIAITLGINKGTVMSRLNRARQAVLERMKGKSHV